MRSNGMTLIEVLAVVVILGLLAATLTVGLSGKFGKARHEIARTQIGQLVGAVELFQMEQKRLPSSSEGLQALSAAADASYYLEASKLQDPWGKPYLYVVPGPAGVPFEIITYGADGQPGGESENADISSAALGAE
ncbi:MAG: type II secretion system major pseudopilin GspG [Planctomycetota bacterium]|nr:type II secretion system major pseudopilin GspG [Planctomycetota bacterium]